MKRAAPWMPAWIVSRTNSAGGADPGESLLEVSRSLASLSEATERDFLVVGEKLQAIEVHFRGETARLSGLLEEIGGQRDRWLGEALEEAAVWAREAGNAVDCGELLAGIAPVARSVNGPVLHLQTSLRTLRVMSIMTRVESARLGVQAAGFEALALRADEMADGVGRKSADILRAVGELCALVEHAGEAVGDIGRRQHAELTRLTGDCSAGLGELRREHTRAAGMADSARAAYCQVSEGINQLVVALQCHDSTRQRLDHVRAALEELAADGCADGGQAIELQAAQLHQASQTFQAEFGKIAAGLDSLAAEAAEVSRLAGEFAGAEGDGGESAAGALERRFAEAGAQVEGWIASRLAMAEAVGEVERKCGEITGFVSEIEAVGAEMLWVALNAEIQAARLSVFGAVMEAVAQGIRRVSQAASFAAAAAGEALRGVKAAAGQLEAALGGDFGLDGRRAADVAGRIEHIVAQLASSGAGHRRLMRSLAMSGAQMAQRIAALRKGIGADRTMALTAEDCLASLARIAAQVRRTEGLRNGPIPWLHRAQKKYAMRAEREVHAAFATVPGGSRPDRDPPPAEDALAPRGESEFGANG